MKKILITGAAGSVGLNIIKLLLKENNYEVTALDLKNKYVLKKLKKYKDRINIIYGDVNDKVLINALVKDHDIIIHLASILPPFAEINKSSSEIVEYEGTNNIIKAIEKNGNKCYLMYASTTSMYDSSLSATVNEKIKEKELTNFALNKYNTEKEIKNRLNNYTIFRIPLVLNNIINEQFIYNIKVNSLIELTTDKDVSNAFVKAINYKNKINKKTYNIGMGKEGRIYYKDVLKNILKSTGISFKYIFSRLFLDNNYNSPVLLDSDKLDDIIKYRNDSLSNYYKRINKIGSKRIIRKIMAKPIVYKLNKK